MQSDMLPLPPERTGQASASRLAAAKHHAILTIYQTLSKLFFTECKKSRVVVCPTIIPAP